MTDKLIPKQEAFAMAYAESGNASKAYKAVYNVNDNASDNSINVEASKLALLSAHYPSKYKNNNRITSANWA